MKKPFVSLILILILCLALGSSSAHSFEEITVGMDQSDVAAFLQEYTITDQTDYYLAYSDQENRIQINFRNGKAMKVRLWMDGLKDSDLDLFYPDWNLSENELLGTLKNSHLYYWYNSDGLLFTSSGKKEIRYYGFYGKMGTNPVDYTLIYSDDGLEQISVRSIESSGTLSGYVSWISWITAELGQPGDAASYLDTDYDDEDSLLLYLSEFTKWNQPGSAYDLELITTIKKVPEDEGFRYEKQGHETELTIYRTEN